MDPYSHTLYYYFYYSESYYIQYYIFSFETNQSPQEMHTNEDKLNRVNQYLPHLRSVYYDEGCMSTNIIILSNLFARLVKRWVVYRSLCKYVPYMYFGSSCI